MTRDQMLAAARQQCRAHGLDFDDPNVRGVITNLLTPILIEWELDRDELKALREQIRVSNNRGAFLEQALNEGDGSYKP